MKTIETPLMTLNVQPVIAKIMHDKVIQIMLHIARKKKIKELEMQFMKSKTMPIEEGQKYIEMKIYYKGDVWITAKQYNGLNGIEKIDFESKYIKAQKQASLEVESTGSEKQFS